MKMVKISSRLKALILAYNRKIQKNWNLSVETLNISVLFPAFSLRAADTSSSLQTLQLWRQCDFLVVSELFQRHILRPNNLDLIADPQVVLVHQLNVLPFLQKTIGINRSRRVNLVAHLLLVTSRSPVRPSARSA